MGIGLCYLIYLFFIANSIVFRNPSSRDTFGELGGRQEQASTRIVFSKKKFVIIKINKNIFGFMEIINEKSIYKFSLFVRR